MRIPRYTVPTANSIPRDGRALGAVLAVVLLVHLCIAWGSRDGVIQDDAESYVLLGQNLAAGHGYVFEPGRAPTSWRAPGYPLWLAGIFLVSDGSLGAARFGSALLWTLTTLLTYLLGRRLVEQRSALVAAMLVGLSPELAGFTGLLWSENLFVCLFMGSLLGVVALATSRPCWYQAGAFGLLMGAIV